MSTWNDFDALCAAQNNRIQDRLEANAMAAIQAAVAEGRGLREAVSLALESGITKENNWLELVGVLMQKPMALATDMDAKFYGKCPKLLIEELVGGKNGLFAQFLDRVNNKPESGEAIDMLDVGDIRLMYMVVDSLHTLGQNDRLKRAAKMFQSICETKCENGLVPSSVYRKLRDLKVIEPPSQVNSNGASNATMRPVRTLHNDGVVKEELTGAKRVDTNPAKPPKNQALPDNSLAAQLAKVPVTSSVN